jgi:glutathione synthase/RimK-type ligase-like ATP-grasp enzyme
MDDALLPEVRCLPASSPVRRRVRSLHDLLIAWMDMTPARVLNRPRAMASNGSKPLQAQLIRAAGFRVPETLVTNDPELVLEFRNVYGSVIYKSISGVRSIVKLLDDADLDRLGRIRWCATQFQQHIAGTDVRVHCVGERVFATEIVSDASDYRYSRRLDGSEPSLRAIELSDELSARCIGLAAQLGLDFAGIDLRRTREGEHYCFEVNPSPAFNYYEAGSGQPIAAAVAEHLAAAAPG